MLVNWRAKRTDTETNVDISNIKNIIGTHIASFYVFCMKFLLKDRFAFFVKSILTCPYVRWNSFCLLCMLFTLAIKKSLPNVLPNICDVRQNPHSSSWAKIYSRVYLKLIWSFFHGQSFLDEPRWTDNNTRREFRTRKTNFSLDRGYGPPSLPFEAHYKGIAFIFEISQRTPSGCCTPKVTSWNWPSKQNPEYVLNYNI